MPSDGLKEAPPLSVVTQEFHRLHDCPAFCDSRPARAYESRAETGNLRGGQEVYQAEDLAARTEIRGALLIGCGLNLVFPRFLKKPKRDRDREALAVVQFLG
jgi:hypothetical protein